MTTPTGELTLTMCIPFMSTIDKADLHTRFSYLWTLLFFSDARVAAITPNVEFFFYFFFFFLTGNGHETIWELRERLEKTVVIFAKPPEGALAVAIVDPIDTTDLAKGRASLQLIGSNPVEFWQSVEPSSHHWWEVQVKELEEPSDFDL